MLYKKLVVPLNPTIGSSNRDEHLAILFYITSLNPTIGSSNSTPPKPANADVGFKSHYWKLKLLQQ